jgi:RimJ/RimL family protein N-acetyltransferase
MDSFATLNSSACARKDKMMMKIEPVTLTGRIARLEPLRIEHSAALFTAIREKADLLRYFALIQPRVVGEMEQLVADSLRRQEQGICLPFAIVDLTTGRVVGETQYYTIDQEHHGLEIGYTWLAPAVQRSGINTECKYLLLSYAFESLGAIRVQLKTHHLNIQSQRAIERLGAVKEGVLRNHVIMPDGSYRHSVYYSIIASEWPQVKAGLEAKMRRAQVDVAH